jgi:hypothetical protein
MATNETKLVLNAVGGEKAAQVMSSIGDKLAKGLDHAKSSISAATTQINSLANSYNKASLSADLLAKKTELAANASKKFSGGGAGGRGGAGGGGAGGGGAGMLYGAGAVLGGGYIGSLLNLGRFFALKNEVDALNDFKGKETTTLDLTKLFFRNLGQTAWYGSESLKHSRTAENLKEQIRANSINFRSGFFEGSDEEYTETQDRLLHNQYMKKDLAGRAKWSHRLGILTPAVLAGGALAATAALAAINANTEQLKQNALAVKELKSSIKENIKSNAASGLSLMQNERQSMAKVFASGLTMQGLKEKGIGLKLGGLLAKGGITDKEMAFVNAAQAAGVSQEEISSDLASNKRLINRGIKRYLKSKGLTGTGLAGTEAGRFINFGDQYDRDIQYAQIGTELSTASGLAAKKLQIQKANAETSAEAIRGEQVSALMENTAALKDAASKLSPVGAFVESMKYMFSSGLYMEIYKSRSETQALVEADLR